MKRREMKVKSEGEESAYDSYEQWMGKLFIQLYKE
jgi:hypothetical protein